MKQEKIGKLKAPGTGKPIKPIKQHEAANRNKLVFNRVSQIGKKTFHMFVGVSTKTACPCGWQGVVQSLDSSFDATTLVQSSSSVEDMKIAWLVLASCVLVLAHAAVPYFDDGKFSPFFLQKYNDSFSEYYHLGFYRKLCMLKRQLADLQALVDS